MTRLLVAVAVAAPVALAAVWIQRRRPAAAPAPTRHHVPTVVERSDFLRPEAPWLVAVFTSSTCSTCAATWEVARPLESAEVAVQQVEVGTEPELHRRYAIDAVPITVVCDRSGGVQQSFLGPVTATHLWAAVAERREPGP